MDLPLRPSTIDLTMDNESPTSTQRRPTMAPRLSTQGVLPPLRSGGDPFKSAGPIFLPPLQRNAATPNAQLQSFPPARAVSNLASPPRRPPPTFTLRGPLPSLAKPAAVIRERSRDGITTVPEVDEKKSDV